MSWIFEHETWLEQYHMCLSFCWSHCCCTYYLVRSPLLTCRYLSWPSQFNEDVKQDNLYLRSKITRSCAHRHLSHLHTSACTIFLSPPPIPKALSFCSIDLAWLRCHHFWEECPQTFPLCWCSGNATCELGGGSCRWNDWFLGCIPCLNNASTLIFLDVFLYAWLLMSVW